MKARLPSTREYAQFVTELKQRIASARLHAARAVNQDLVLLYWDIGRGILERQEKLGWGQSVVEMLAHDLQKAFPGISGFSARNLWDMRRFYSVYSDPQILRQAVAEFGKLKRSLSAGKTHNFPTVLPEYLAEQAGEALKSSYNLEFLGIQREAKERKLEARLIERLREFILELGYGFCFIGQQHRLTLGRKEYFIDLLFYHRFLKSLVAIELKAGPFEPAHAGQMDFYLNVLNEKERSPGDNPSIGIILCAEKDNLEVEFALKTKTNPIGVAEYHLTEKLPKELKGKLPNERQLLAAVKEAIEA